MIRVSGVFGILVGMRRLSGILIVLVCNILSKLISINHKVLKVKITNGSHIGNIGLIPRIDLTPSEISYHLEREEGNFLLGYAMQ